MFGSANLPPATFVRTAPNLVAIVQSQVIQAGGDPEAVAAWVEQHGGYLDQAADFLSENLGPDYGRVKLEQTFFAVPRDALR